MESLKGLMERPSSSWSAPCHVRDGIASSDKPAASASSRPSGFHPAPIRAGQGCPKGTAGGGEGLDATGAERDESHQPAGSPIHQIQRSVTRSVKPEHL